VEANRAQAETICKTHRPLWVVGDSIAIDEVVPKGTEADLLFSCPPYADLEQYSDDPRDLSTMEYDAFLAAYAVIIKRSLALLKPDRFAVFVVGDVRDKKGLYRNLTGNTVAAFELAGARLYNEAILVTPAGSLPLRTSLHFRASRKMGKSHQNVYVFVKGDPRKAADACAVIEEDKAELARLTEAPVEEGAA
jgi:hypothetical protein